MLKQGFVPGYYPLGDRGARCQNKALRYLQAIIHLDHAGLVQKLDQRVTGIKLTFPGSKVAAARVYVVVVVIAFAKHQPVNLK